MITILGNVNEAGYALPMTQAYPVDPNVQSLLAWNPTVQALDYVPYTGNVLGDFGIARDLAVIRDAAIGRNATVAGTLAVTGVATFVGQVAPFASSGVIGATGYNVNGTSVVGSRKTGWAAATGTATRTTFVTSTVTLPLLAERVKALIDDLTSHGLIGT